MSCKKSFTADERKRIGERIKRKRNVLGLTQEALANLADVSTNHIGTIERGEKEPSLKTLSSIAQALDSPIDYFIFGDSFPSNNELVGYIEMANKASKTNATQFYNIIRTFAPLLLSKNE